MSFQGRPGGWSTSRPLRSQRGITLLELLGVLAVVALVVTWSAPALGTLLRRSALRAAAFDLAGLVRRLRHQAAARSRYEAWQFSQRSGRWHMQRFIDGNGNGVRAIDLSSGVDAPVGSSLDLSQRWSRVRLALPDYPLPRIPPARGVLAPESDPLRLSGTDRISCAPNGSCTGGTMYLSTEGKEVAAVVVYGITGRVRVWRYEPGASEWIRY